MGNNNSSTVKNVVDVTTEQIFKSITEVKNECMQNTTASNEINLKFEDPCADMTTDTGRIACKKIAANTEINIANITQDTNILAVAECEFKNGDETKINDKIAEKLKQEAKNQDDGFTKALNSISNPGGDNSSNVLNETTLKKVLKTELTTKFYNNLSENVQTENLFNFAAQTIQNINVTDLKQTIKVKAVAKSLNDNSKVTDIIRTVDQDMNNSAENETKGVTNIMDSVMGFFKNGQNLSMIAVAIIAIVIIVTIISFFATGGQQTLREGMHRGANIANARANPLGKMGGGAGRMGGMGRMGGGAGGMGRMGGAGRMGRMGRMGGLKKR